MLFRFWSALAVVFTVSLFVPSPSRAEIPDSSSADQGWPRPLSTQAGTFSIYQPQIDKFDGFEYQAHAAVAVKAPGDTRDTFGVIWIDARSLVDKQSRLVALRDIDVSRVQFPSVADQGQAFKTALRNALKAGPLAALSPISLDRLEASLAIGQAERKGEHQPLKNDPPKLLLSTVPAILVSIDGAPVWRPVKGSNLKRVVNTKPLLVRDENTFYLHLYDGWLQASALEGPWTVAANPPAALATAVQSLSKEVDLLDGSGPDTDSPKPSLANTPAPVVHVATAPTELIVTEGDPDYVNIPETQLLYVRNTTGHVFKDINDQSWYVLVSGRWYRASDLAGSWSYVEPTQLPRDFARIPDESPKENVKASVPGTQQAEEAVIANQIPQTATVKRSGTAPTPPPTIDGPAQLEPIENTPLQSVANASAPIIRADDGRFYLVQNGLWFVADSPTGPWVVAASVPPSIYSIPPASPLHHVTYVYVYGSTPEVVYTGYTPGYLGVEVLPAGVVVYGTGYYYRPWIGRYWYPPPRTFGFGWGLAYTPWCGWSYGWGFGPVSMSVGGGWWYPRPWWGVYQWGGWRGPYRPVVSNSVNINIYQRYGGNRVIVSRPIGSPPVATGPGTKIGTAYNSRTGMPAAGQRGSVVKAFTPHSEVQAAQATKAAGIAGHAAAANSPSVRPAPAPVAPHAAPAAPHAAAAPRPTENHVYADKNGQVYRQTPNGWEQHSPNGTWNGVKDPQRAQTLSRESAARGSGEAKAHSFNQAQSNLGTMHPAPQHAPSRVAGPSHSGGVRGPSHGGGFGGAPKGGGAPFPRGSGGRRK